MYKNMNWIEKNNEVPIKKEVHKTNTELLNWLKISLETRTQHWDFAKDIFWTNLEKANYLARIDEVTKTCNNNKEEFLKGCSEKFNLQLPYLA